jgi:voltage-gated potassium channel
MSTSETIAGPIAGWRAKVHEVIYEAETGLGKAFDVSLFWLIVASVAVVMLESVSGISTLFARELRAVEWMFTVLFTVEYVLRLISIRRPTRYAFSFFGVIDFLAVIPTYLSLMIPATRFMVVIRILRLLRVFRVLKLARFLHESGVLIRALRASRIKILVFLYSVLVLVVIIGAIMYVVEGEVNGFTSIPRSVYWAIVTLTTVGYGDISPQTPLGQFFASIVMIMGYGIIAIPTGIVTAELARPMARVVSTETCSTCSREGHDPDAVHCKFCGGKL